MADADLTFDIEFHGPFRVATGSAGGGLDATVDPDNPLPASSLKGLMLDAARTVLRARPGLVAATFGTELTESPWSWTDAQPVDAEGRAQAGWQRRSVATRVSIDEDTHTAIEGRVMFGEIVEQPLATCHVLATVRRDAKDPELAAQQSLLRAAAAAVHQLGADRRRGLGWVSITSRDRSPIVAADLELIGWGQGRG